MFIDNGNINSGFIGIGPNFSAPQSLLHLNGTRNTFAQFTNAVIGTGANSGFGRAHRCGAATAGHAWLNQQGNFPMDFFTNGIERMAA